LALLSQRDLVPAIWLPDPRVREERELARSRLHLVKHRSQLKHRIHSTLMSFGRPRPVSDLFGVRGRELLAKLEVPEPWRGNVLARPVASRFLPPTPKGEVALGIPPESPPPLESRRT
jgi:transposase